MMYLRNIYADASHDLFEIPLSIHDRNTCEHPFASCSYRRLETHDFRFEMTLNDVDDLQHILGQISYGLPQELASADLRG